MYLGIDLGTSNSAIVGAHTGGFRLFKSVEGGDVLPSAILIDRRGGMTIGKRAYDQAAFAAEDLAYGFKRLMGTSSPITFASSGKVMTPEQASAEILKTLLAQARMAGGDFDVEGAVVTIPAAFNQMQSEATMNAAAAAGLSRIGLLQEPVAAAMAAIATSEDKNGQFLVYDLGGGTFDVAIVQCVRGAVSVISHAGVNMLGGRDFDRAIVNSIVRPWLAENFDLPPDFQSEPGGKRLLRTAQFSAENAKISLSTCDVDRIVAPDRAIDLKDRQGRDVYLEVELTRSDLDRLVGASIDRSIEVRRKLIAESGYKSEDIDRIVLIGGPSNMPIVRSRVPAELGIDVDVKTDPMTAVAHGAAIFAEGRDWSGSVSTPKSTRASARTRGPLDIRFAYPARTSDERMRLRVHADPGVTADHGMQIAGGDGWFSGRLPVADVPDIAVPKLGENRFRITIFDPDGIQVPEAGAEIVVTRTAASAAGIPATQNIAVKVSEGRDEDGRNTLHVLVAKGTLLPENGTEKFRAARDLRAGDGNTIDFELYQQSDGVDDPKLALEIGAFRIDSVDLERGELIRRGDEITCFWSMDDNGILNCALEIPAIGRRYEVGKYYVAAVGHKNFEGNDGLQLAIAVIDEAERDLKELQDTIAVSDPAEVERLARQIEMQQQSLTFAWEADTKRSIAEEARLVRQEIARIRLRPENEVRALASDIKQFRTFYDGSVRAGSDAQDNMKVDRLVADAEACVARGTPEAVKDGKRSLEEANARTCAELLTRPEYIARMFRDFAADRHYALDKDLHDRHVRDGETAIAAGETDSVRSIIHLMLENMIRRAGHVTSPAARAGLMRW